MVTCIVRDCKQKSENTHTHLDKKVDEHACMGSMIIGYRGMLNRERATNTLSAVIRSAAARCVWPLLQHMQHKDSTNPADRLTANSCLNSASVL